MILGNDSHNQANCKKDEEQQRSKKRKLNKF